MGTLLGVPITRIVVFFGGLYWGPLILGNYHIGACRVHLKGSQGLSMGSL